VRRAGRPTAEPGVKPGPRRRVAPTLLTDERQRKVADALGDLARAELQDDRKRASARSPSGADRAHQAAKGNR
jgi:hypothetical protein